METQHFSSTHESRLCQEPLTTDGNEVLDVTVLLLDEGYASTAVGPIEVLQSAGLLWNSFHGAPVQPRFRIRTATLSGGSVTSLCSLRLEPQFAIHEIAHTDVIIVPASGWDVVNQINKSGALLRWLRDWHERGALIAGISTGVGFLAESGILDGREATTHWAVTEAMKKRYPKVLWTPDRIVTEDRGVLCSSGICAAVDLSLYLVEKFCGHEVSLQCAKSLVASMPRTSQAGYSIEPLSRPHQDEKIHRCEEFLKTHFAGPVSLDFLASHVGMSPRNFIRRFKSATGRLPSDYIQMLRITTARALLESGTQAVQTISTMVGYEDLAFFRSLFKRHTGMTPTEYRATFSRSHIRVSPARPRAKVSVESLRQ